MSKKRLRRSVTGIAISLSLLSGTALAVAKPSPGLQEPTQQPYLISKEYITLAKTLSIDSQEPPQQPYLISSEYISLAKTLSLKVVRSTFAASLAEPVKVQPQQKAIAAPANTPEIKYEANKKVQPVAAVHTNADTSPKSQNTASTQTHTLEVSPGKTVQFKRLIPATATAYTAAAAENGSWGAFDYFGNPLKVGTIAVDPAVIPLGSTVYITGYQYNGLPAKGMIAKATDVGGAIKGKRVDIFVPASRTDASDFGMQDVKVYIIK